MVESNEITVVIAEDHEITRVGLKLTLEQMPGLKIIGQAEDGKQILDVVSKLHPDVVLMDVGLPNIDGIDATRQIKELYSNVRIIMLTSHDNDDDVFAALGAGADGYCLKDISSHQLSMAIKTVYEGAAWLDPGVASRVLRACAVNPRITHSTSQETTPSSSSLSQREVDVLRLVVEGKSNQEIADVLVLSIETVKTHMRHIMEKLAVSDRTQAAVKAMRQGLI